MTANEATAEAEATYRLSEHVLGELRAEVEKLAKAAAKIGVPAVALAIRGWETAEVPAPDGIGFPRIVRFATVALTGTAPVLPGGWTLVATLQHGSSGTVVRTVPGAETPARFREANPDDCDHCHKRRRRLDTFVVRSQAGEYRQVGRDCLRDFLGYADPALLAAYLEHVFDLAGRLSEGEADSGGGNLGGRGRLRTADVLALSAGATRQFGFVSRRQAESEVERGLQTTAQRVRDNLYDVRRLMERRPDDVIRPDSALAQDAAAWYLETLEATPVEQRSEFEHNLLILLRDEGCEDRSLGYLAFVPAGYLKAQERATQPRGTSAHVGAVKSRIRVEATVRFVRAFDGNYGTTFLTKLETGENGEHVLVWWGSYELQPGDVVKGVATVKAHETRDGAAQTVITRPKWDVTPA